MDAALDAYERAGLRHDDATRASMFKLTQASVRVGCASLTDLAERVASLTPTQLRVLIGVLAGRLNKQIAFDLSISEATVKTHMTSVLRKLNVGNRTQAALAARALGLETAGHGV